jgi:hypothetical protein
MVHEESYGEAGHLRTLNPFGSGGPRQAARLPRRAAWRGRTANNSEGDGTEPRSARRRRLERQFVKCGGRG